MSPTKRNYDIYDKELLALVRAFKEYRVELTPYSDTDALVRVITDYKNLKYFTTTKRLNLR